MTATRRAFLGYLGAAAAAVVATTGPLAVPAAPALPPLAPSLREPLARFLEALAHALETWGPEDWAAAVEAETRFGWLAEGVRLAAEISADGDRLGCAAALREKAAEVRAGLV